MQQVQMILRVGLRRLMTASIYKSYENNMKNLQTSKLPSELTHHSNAEELISRIPVIEIDGDVAHCRVCAEYRGLGRELWGILLNLSSC